tara:strand:- start:1365 stop:2249 length:885 start_codon:yes stop_codon:yes gene_type:complete
MSQLADTMLENLKCVICSEYFCDMMQCYNGHSHCKECLKKYEQSLRSKQNVKCTVCMSKKGWCTNRQTVMIASAMGLQLMCGIDGCEKMLDMEDLEHHRNICPKRLYICPVHGLECQTMRYDELYRHVSEHKKVINMQEKSVLNVMISELVNYGPRTILFDSEIIVFNAYVTYDRRCDTRLVIKCVVIGPNGPSNVKMETWYWNMLSQDSYTYNCKDLLSTHQFTDDIEEGISLHGCKNYVSELSDTVVVAELLSSANTVKPPDRHFISCKIHEFDVNEDCQEVYVFSIKFSRN